jgi:hypothetical protein
VDEIDIARAASASDGSGLDDEEIDETELKIFEAISRLGTSHTRGKGKLLRWSQ